MSSIHIWKSMDVARKKGGFAANDRSQIDMFDIGGCGCMTPVDEAA